MPGPCSTKLWTPIRASVGGEGGHELRRLQLQGIIERQIEAVVHGGLGVPQRRRSRGEALGHGHRLVVRLRCRVHGVGQTDGQGLLGMHTAAAVDDLLGAAEAHEARQALGAAGAGDDAQQDLGLAEDRIIRRQAEVGGHRQLTAAPEGVPVHGRHQNLRDALQLPQSAGQTHGCSRAGVGVARAEFLDVGTGGEDPGASPQDGSANVRTPPQLLGHGGELR